MIFRTESRARAHARALSRKHGCRFDIYRRAMLGSFDYLAVDGSLGALPRFPGGRECWAFVGSEVVFTRAGRGAP